MTTRRLEVGFQLNELEDGLFMNLSHFFVFNMGFNFWEETDTLDTDSNAGVEDSIWNAFQDMMSRYEKHSGVTIALENLCLSVQNAVWAAINVPYPRDPHRHLDIVAQNACIVYRAQIFDLQRELIQANHHVEVIQRVWRRVISDPSCKMCINRLNREFYEDLPDLKSSLV
jgi:hypothetical protein